MLRSASAYGVYISELIRYSRACRSYHGFLDRGLMLTIKYCSKVPSGYLESFTVATITWLTNTEYLCHK